MYCMGSLDGARAWRFFTPVAASFTARGPLAGETPVAVLRDCSPRCPHFRREPLFTQTGRRSCHLNHRAAIPGALHVLGSFRSETVATTVACRSLEGPEPPRRWQAMGTVCSVTLGAGMKQQNRFAVYDERGSAGVWGGLVP